MSGCFNRTVVGSAGFVGQSLIAQSEFDGQFNRGNFDELADSIHNLLIFASAPAKKWLANSSPDSDRDNIDYLVRSMRDLEVKKFVLISTVDVYDDPIGVNEQVAADATAPNHYGVNRLYLEDALRQVFPSMLAIRLPGLVGTGLRKNALFDMKNSNEVGKLNGASEFQFYPMKHLAEDIEIGIQSELQLLHLTAEPVLLSDVGRDVFGLDLGANPANAVSYDFRTAFSSLWGSAEPYQYSRTQSLDAIREYKKGVRG